MKRRGKLICIHHIAIPSSFNQTLPQTGSVADNSVGPSSMLGPGLHFTMSNTDIYTITFYDQSEKFSLICKTLFSNRVLGRVYQANTN